MGDEDPVENYRRYLKETIVLSDEEDELIRAEIKKEIDTDWAKVQEEPAIIATLEGELGDVYAPYDFENFEPSNEN